MVFVLLIKELAWFGLLVLVILIQILVWPTWTVSILLALFSLLFQYARWYEALYSNEHNNWEEDEEEKYD